MSFQKKNVYQEFMKEDYIPTAEQFLVKYCSGKGNNLHEVECLDGTTLLVSMPKKFRHTVWLKKDDCLVIDPIEEGKKVRGEIVCVLSQDSVHDLITNHQYPSKSDSDVTMDTDSLLQFFTNGSSERKANGGGDVDMSAFPPSDSSEDEEDVEEEEEEETSDAEEDKECDNGEESKTESELDNSNEGPDDDTDDLSTTGRNRSRVQLVTSGVVTVTNVITEGLENDIQSLEFEADEEESSDELSNISRDLERHANTIRIQVNYNNANTTCSGASGD